jgi:PAS domain S-box-containing protein
MSVDDQLNAAWREHGDIQAALARHAMVAIVDPAGKITYVNDGFCALSKYPREELIGQGHGIVDSGEHVPEFRPRLWSTLANGQAWQGEIRHRAKDGCFFWTDTTIIPSLDEQGNPRQFTAILTDITERKRLEEVQGALVAIVESSEDAIIGKNLEGIITSWNAGAENIFGYRAAEILGKSVTLLIPPEQEGEEAAILARIRRGERVKHFETIRLRRDGTRIAISATISPIKDQAGTIVGASKIARDVTAQKSVEESLRRSLRDIRDLKVALDEHAIVAVTDARGRIVEVNDKFCAISKYRRDELIGQDHRIINSGHHPKEFFRELWQTIGRAGIWHGEIKNRAKDGSFYWVATTIVPFLDDQGKPRQYIAIRADITAHKAAVEESERQVTLFDQTYDAVLAWKWQGPIEFWNRGAERLYGFTRAEAIGRTSHQLLQTRFPEGLEALLGALNRDGQWEGELEHTTRAGQTIRVESRMVLVQMAGQGSVLEANRDITERRRIEQEIRQLNLVLEQRVRERTAELAAANRELEAFSYSVSHDLRAPLRAMDGFSQAVLEDFGPLLPAEGHRYLETIRTSAQRMGALIDDLLAFARLNRHPLRRQPIDTFRLVNSALADLGSPWPERKIEVRVDDLPACWGDPSLLRQVWLNLLSNALKYTRKSAVAEIVVAAAERQGEVEYSVADNGAGFDMDYADKLFGVFQRLHRTEDFEGTGVGLAIVQRIVQRHGGRVWAEGKVDGGATFHFTLGGENKS